MAGIAAGLLLLAVAAVVIVTMLIDPNHYKGQVEKQVRQLTGRPFEIQGNLEIAWFPWLGLRTGSARLGNAPGMAGPPLAQWQSLQLDLRLLPLLRGAWEVGKIRLEGLSVSLQRFADGRANWEGLLSSGSESGQPSALALNGLEIRNGSLRYSNAVDGMAVSLSRWQLDMGAWKAGAKFPIHTRFDLARAAGAPVSVELDVPQLELVPKPLAVTVPHFVLQVAAARLSGSIFLASANPLRGRGQLSFSVGSLRELIKQLVVAAPLPRDQSTLRELTLNASWSVDGATGTADPIELRIDDTRLRGNLRRGADAIWHMELQGDRIDLGRYVAIENQSAEPFELPVEALRHLEAAGTLSFDEARLDTALMKNLRLRWVMEQGRLRNAESTPSVVAP